MGYSFTSRRWSGFLSVQNSGEGDVMVVLDRKANTGKNNNASRAVSNLLNGVGISLHTVSSYKITL